MSHRRGLTNGTSPISNDLAAGVEVISIKHPSDKSEGEPAQGTAKRKRSDMELAVVHLVSNGDGNVSFEDAEGREREFFGQGEW